ncbi:MAG: alpha-ketoglutarate-dependent dioxygenase AlkB family protein [Burkholderiaceae bacterium]
MRKNFNVTSAIQSWEAIRMTFDFFPEVDRLDRIPLQQADIYYLPQLALEKSSDAIMHELIDRTPWRVEHIVMWGRTVAQPRLCAWYGDEGSAYAYSGIHLTPLPWTALLLDLKNRVESVADTSFNSVLLNYYRDNRDSMGFHSDDEAELGDQPVIASLSLGEERAFILKHKTAKTVKPHHLKLASGSLLLMKGDTQKYWKHGINKVTHLCGPRVNLTFRCIKN